MPGSGIVELSIYETQTILNFFLSVVLIQAPLMTFAAFPKRSRPPWEPANFCKLKENAQKTKPVSKGHAGHANSGPFEYLLILNA